MNWSKEDKETLRQCLGVIGLLHLKYQNLTGKTQSSSGDMVITSGDAESPKKEGLLSFDIKLGETKSNTKITVSKN